MNQEIRLTIHGMTCEHCVATVKQAAGRVTGVGGIEVDLESGLAVVEGEAGLDPQQVVSAIQRAGYSAALELGSPSRADSQAPKAPSAVQASKPNGADADLIVIGGGSAGFAAAIRGHELGAKVIMVNKGTIGGTCVNVGCIPSKTLIRAAEAGHRAAHARFTGIESSANVSDFGAIIRQKDELVGSLRQAKYIDVLASYENVRLVEGHARFVTPRRVEVGGHEISAPSVVVAAGSRPYLPPIPGLREADPLTSTTAFELERLPESVIILGGRYIALECAQMLARLGARVTILQRSDHLLPDEDEDMTTALAGYLREEGIKIETSMRIQSVARHNGQVSVHAQLGSALRIFHAERILAATGRQPNTEDMGLEDIGAKIGEGGRLIVDDYLQTSVAGIYAGGDAVGEPAFVYTAAYEGRLAAENALNGNSSERDYRALPWVIFTDPQIAGVGLNEREAVRKGIAFDVSKISLSAVPRALAARDTRGFIKLLKEQGGDRLIGARVLAQEGGEQVMEAAMAIRFGIGASDIAAMFHPYLTQSEGVKLCAQAFSRDLKKLSCCS